MLVAQRIVRDAVRGRLAPGDLLPSEREMQDTYQIGRGTLREALRLLEFQGLITLKPGPGGGPQLRKPDGSHLASSLMLQLQMNRAPYRVIVETRMTLEPMISRLAATRISKPMLDDLATTIEDMRRSSKEDPELFFEANKRFHEIISESCDNALFAFIVNSMLEITGGTAMGMDYAADRREGTLHAHEAIFEAMTKGDPDAAEHAMTKHLEAYKNYSETRYPELLEQTITWELM